MRLSVRTAYRSSSFNVSPFVGRFVNLEQIMKVQVRTKQETSVNWINILCISTGLVVGIIMVTPYLPGEETAHTPPKAAVRFSLGDNNADGIVTTRQRAPVVHRNVDRLRENGLRYQQPETGLRSNNSAAEPRTLDPSKDPIISTVPKAPIITSSEAITLKNQSEAEEAVVQTAKSAEQKTEVVADSNGQDFSSNDKSANEEKSKDLVASQDPNKAIPKQSDFALPEFNFPAIELPAIELPAIELPTIELPELAKVFEFGSEQIALPTESNEPKIDADAVVRQHLQKQDSITNSPVQPDMDLVAKRNVPAINYPTQQLPGLAKNMALVQGLNTNVAITNTDPAADGIAGQLIRDINMGSSFVPTQIHMKPERIRTTPEIVEREQIVTVQTSPMDDPETSTEKLSSTEISQQAEEPQSEKLISNGKSSSGFSLPKFEFPVIELPEMSLPEFELPSFQLPQTSLPECCCPPVKQAKSEHPLKPATPAVAVEQKPAPIVSKEETAISASRAIFSP